VEEQDGRVKLLYLFLFTGPKVNTVGLLKMSLKKIGEYIAQDREATEHLMRYMITEGKVLQFGEWFWVKNFIRDQIRNYHSKDILTGMKNALQECSRPDAVKAVLTHYEHIPIPYPDRLKIISGRSPDRLTIRNNTVRDTTPPPPEGGGGESKKAPGVKYPFPAEPPQEGY